MDNEFVENKETFENLIETIKFNIRFLITKWKTLLFFGFLFSILSIIYLSITKQTYKATITFVAESSGNDKLGSYAGIAAQFGVDLGQSGSGIFDGDNLLEVFKSRRIIEGTLLSEYLSNPKQSFIQAYLINHNIKTGNGELQFDGKHTNRRSDSIMSIVYKKIVSEQLIIDRKDKKISLVGLEMTDVDELFAKKFVEALCENTVSFYTNYKTKKSSQNLLILEHQVDSLSNLITGRIYAVAESVDLNVNPQRQIAKAPTQRKNVDLTVATAVYTEVLKQMEIAKITFRKESPLIQIIDTPILPLKKLKLGRVTAGIAFFCLGIFVATLIVLVRKTFSKMKK